MIDYFKNPLFVFEMANNHMGSIEHGLKMINSMADVAQHFSFRFAFKFQFRHFDSFIHPDYKSRMDLKYVKRFSETRLTKEEFQALKETAERHGFVTICTPFDEPSVDLVEEMGFDIIKVASCSFTDWPLLERIVRTDKPVIASTSGAALADIDRVVNFFVNRNKQLAIMHCIGEYPTTMEHLQLNQIDLLKQRYPAIPVGFSTHEEPSNIDSIKLAIAKGALIFEKHVAVETQEFKKNNYSATPEQIFAWLCSADKAFHMCGISGRRYEATKQELADLGQFKRGVFAARKISKGEKFDQINTFFAFPNGAGQLLANDMSKYIDYYAEQDIEKNAAISIHAAHCIDRREQVYNIVERVKHMLTNANVVVPGMAELEISHHYGFDRFEKYGCTIINVINREYCKKLIILFPGQKHPEQFHKLKEETFVVLYGDVNLILDGVSRQCKRGDVVTINRGVKHPFSSEQGAIIEEISSTHFKDDSYYTDETILQNNNRKTVLAYWLGEE